jgi:uncharacterized RDD family membrane protein YckC
MDKPFASPGRRFLAQFIDGLLLQAVQLAGALLGGTVASVMTDPDAAKKVVEGAAASGAMLGMLFWLYVALFMNSVVVQGLTGATIGKWVMGIRVVNRDGSPIGILKAFGRLFAYVLSYLPLLIGFVALFWDKERRCWHDRACGTAVIRKGAVYPAAAAAPPGPSQTGSFPNAA